MDGNYYDQQCPLCPETSLEDAKGDWLWWVAHAIGGPDNVQFTALVHEDRGTVLVPGDPFDFWIQDPRYNNAADCPVCHGWGVWSNNGIVSNCLACGTGINEYRLAYDPLIAFWQPWWLGSGIFVPRGTSEI